MHQSFSENGVRKYVIIKHVVKYVSYAAVFVFVLVATQLIGGFVNKTNIIINGDYSYYGVSEDHPVIIYTIKSCPACQQLKSYLDNHGTIYVNKDIDDSIKFSDEFESFGVNTIPVVLAGDKMIVGFHKEVIADVIKGMSSTGRMQSESGAYGKVNEAECLAKSSCDRAEDLTN